MAKEPLQAAALQDYTAQEVIDLTVDTNLVVQAGADENAYELRNALLLEKKLARVRYENGVTLPASAKKLRADAERKVRHSRTLARNIKKATGIVKHADADAHHIVAAMDHRAGRARTLLFKWGIGINDADNGLYLPKKWSSTVPGLEDATAHEVIHTTPYYIAVTAKLRAARPSNSANGRQALRGIKQDILSDDFTY